MDTQISLSASLTHRRGRHPDEGDGLESPSNFNEHQERESAVDSCHHTDITYDDLPTKEVRQMTFARTRQKMETKKR